MARRTLGTRGRILAAGLSVGAAAALMGAMAATDHAGANPSVSSSGSQDVTTPSDRGFGAQPYDQGGSTRSAPSAHTRSGGS